VERLEAEDFVVQIVAPSLLNPLPRQTLLSLLMDKERVAIVEETHAGPGFGSELAASLLEERYAGRLRRIGTPPVPIPAARSLEAAVLPGEEMLFQRLASFVTDAD
jgi:2-oxoisovalerate dehydrogenase E1 component